MVRTLSEILIDADNWKGLCDLNRCWNEIVVNKYKYPLCQLLFAKEHIQGLLNEENELAKEITGIDFKPIKL